MTHRDESGEFSRRAFLGSAALLPAALRGDDPPSAPLLDHVRIGAEFFLNRTETRDTVFGHFRRMAETGLTIARIFTIWDQIEPAQGQWDFQGYDWIYDAAAQNGILIANTLCSEDPPGWMGTVPFYHAWQDLSNPQLRRYSEIYLEKVVTRYKAHPAHGVWLLQNEPGIQSAPDKYVQAEYARWLEQKYGTVENLNKLWYVKLRRFEDVTIPGEARTGWVDYPPLLDWRRFRSDHLASQLHWLHAQIDKHHPGALTHINPPGLTGNMPAAGRDIWRLKPTAHFLGTSMHASWHFGMFARSDFGVAYGYCCDLLRSVSGGSPWWVTELQAGPTVFTGARPLNPTGGEITRWLWDGIGDGARAIVFWLWHPRTEGNEAGEWGLAGPAGEPTDRTRATQAVAEVLARRGSFLRVGKPLPTRAAILYNRDTMLLAAIDGAKRPSEEPVHALMGCYKALHRAHVPVDFLDTSELETGQAKRYQVLYLPYCYALSANSARAIREFVSNGGTLWADGLVGWKDEQGLTRALPPGPLSDVFGFTLDDVNGEWEPFSLGPNHDRAGELWRCLIPSGKSQPLVVAADGRPSAVEHRFGKGRAIYYGTALTLGYLRRESPEVAAWIAAPAQEVVRDLPVRLSQGPPNLTFRAMQAPGQAAAFLNNWGDGGPATVQFRGAAQSAIDIISGKALPIQRTATHSEVTVSLAAGGAAVILASL